MRALIWKEVRELFPAFILILCAAIMLGIVDVWYNWDKDRFVGISLGFCWLISMATALLSGANVMAREAHGHLSFLSSWPISRARIWAVKVAVTVVMLALLLVLSYGICTGLLVMRGYDAWHIYTEMIPIAQHIQIATLVGLFCFTLMFSTLLRSPMAAAGLGLLFGWAVVLLHIYLTYDYLPGRWGPWLGMGVLDISEAAPVVTFIFIPLVAVVAAAWGFMRTPIMESWRRVGRTFGTYGVLVGVGFALTVVALLLTGRPSARLLSSVELDPTGHWLAVTARDQGWGGLWLMDVEGQHRRLVARGPVEDMGWSPAGDRLFLQWGYRSSYWEELVGPWHWVVEVPSGHKRRLRTRAERYRNWYWYEADRLCSPKGTYVPVGERTFMTLAEGNIEYIDMPEQFMMSDVIGWAPDEKRVYWSEKSWLEDPTGTRVVDKTVIRVTRLPQLQTRTVAEFSGHWWVTEISPDGRWFVTWKHISDKREGRLSSPAEPAYRMILVDLTSGRMHYFDDFSPGPEGWTPDGSHIWCKKHAYSEDIRKQELKLLDLNTAQTVHTIGCAELDGQIPWYISISPQGDRMYVTSYDADERGKRKDRHVWTAKPDGTDLRMVAKVDGDILGWTHDGDLLVWKLMPENTIARLDLDTGEKRVIFAPERR